MPGLFNNMTTVMLLDAWREVLSEVEEKSKGAALFRSGAQELPPWHSIGFFDDLAEQFGIAMVMESCI